LAEDKKSIDFAGGQRSSDEPLAGAIPQSINVVVDQAGAIHVRPGIGAWDGFHRSPNYSDATSVDGIAVWQGYPVYVTSDRQIHTQMGGVGVDLSDATAASKLDGASRPVFATTRTRIVIAGGGSLQKWLGPSAVLSQRLGGAPAATHVVANSQRLIVNPIGLSGQIQWSEAGEPNHETWLGEFMELESKPDPLPSLYESAGELIGGGTETVQTLAPDPEQIYASIRTFSAGFGGPYSYVDNDETFGFLDWRKRIQLGNGRSYEDISKRGITKSLQELADFSDCWGFRIQHGGYNLLGWNFPTVGRCFVWDTNRETWSEFRGYRNGQWAPWAAQCMTYWPDENIHLVGLGDGTIGKLSTSALDDNGDPIVAEVTSGFSDEGVDNYKLHIRTRFMFRRGIADGETVPPPRCQLFWRDDTGAWESPIELEFGDPSDPRPTVEVRCLGTYVTRQWRLRMSDNVPLTLVGAVTTYETLED
jgi:hypothetical protein